MNQRVGHTDAMQSALSPTGEPLVQGQGVGKSYGSFTVLQGASFSVRPGITGLLGANGTGKTTLIGMILGLHPVDEGTLTVFGRDPVKAGPEIRARLGYAPEHHTLPGDTQAVDFVTHLAQVHGLPRNDARTRASDALYLVGLGEERFRPMGTMSTGQRQRVKLAQAIAHDPALILLDEPTDGLDPMQRDDMLELIATVSDRYGISVLLSSHLLGEVEQICQDVVIIGDGRVLVSGPIDAIRGEGTGLIVEVDRPERLAELADWLSGRGLRAAPAGSQVTVEGSDDAAFDVVTEGLAELGLGLRRMQRRRLSLEDVFLEQLG